MKKVRITVTIDEDIRRALENQRIALRQSVSGMTNWLLGKALGLIGDAEQREDTEHEE